VEKFTLPSLFEKLFTIHSKVRYTIMNEMKKITLTARKSDFKRIIQNMLAVAVGNFEQSGKTEIMETSHAILGNDPQKALTSLNRYIEDVEEYRQQINMVIELVEEHMLLDDTKVSINFKSGTKVPMDDVNAMFAESKAKNDEKKKKVKAKIKSKKSKQEK
jgi:membrane-anchored protein YejM (alkaline phosphatase superfamily)